MTRTLSRGSPSQGHIWTSEDTQNLAGQAQPPPPGPSPYSERDFMGTKSHLLCHRRQRRRGHRLQAPELATTTLHATPSLCRGSGLGGAGCSEFPRFAL